MKTLYVAKSVPVLNFSLMPDDDGQIIPPKAMATFGKVTPVVYEAGSADVIGKARLYRSGDVLLADMSLISVWFDRTKSEAAIRKLYPAVCFVVTAASGPTVNKLDVKYLMLTRFGNIDTTVLPLGKRLIRLVEKTELN